MQAAQGCFMTCDMNERIRKPKHNVTVERLRQKPELKDYSDEQLEEMIRQMERLAEITLRHLFNS
ncbi:hypothetical protein GCM10009122_22570 [Fulvivirga kasyanovii]